MQSFELRYKLILGMHMNKLINLSPKKVFNKIQDLLLMICANYANACFFSSSIRRGIMIKVDTDALCVLELVITQILCSSLLNSVLDTDPFR